MNQLWKSNCKNIILSFVATTVAPVLFVLLMLFLGKFALVLPPFYIIAMIIAGSLTWIGFVIWYIVSLMRFSKVQPTTLDNIYFEEVAASFILVILSGVFGNVPFFTAFIQLMASVILIRAIRSLLISPSYDMYCKKGFKYIYLAGVLRLIFAVVSMVTTIAYLFVSPSFIASLLASKIAVVLLIIAGILLISLLLMSLVFTFIGWMTIMKHAPEVEE